MSVTLPPSPIFPDAPNTDDLRVSLKRVAALYQIGQEMLQASSEEQALRIAVDGLVLNAGYTSAMIALADQRKRLLQTVAERNNRNLNLPGFAVPLDVPMILNEVVLSGKADIIADAQEYARQTGWGEAAEQLGIQAMVMAAFGDGRQIQGGVSVGTPKEMQVEEELTLLRLFASQLSTALIRIKLDTDRNAALAAADIAQQRLLETVRELSTPAIPIYDGILVLPLVGNIDTGRASQVMEAVLGGIAREQASVVIVDVTGVPIIDTGVANHLVQVTQAAQLLGARCLLVGIKPEVAQTLVQLGVNLSSIVTRSNLQAGVAFALENRGLRITASRN